LDYHKHIFDSCSAVFLDDRREDERDNLNRIIRRFFNVSSEPDNKPTLQIYPYEFILESSHREEDVATGKCKTRFPAIILETDIAKSNNLIDFLENIKTCSEIESPNLYFLRYSGETSLPPLDISEFILQNGYVYYLDAYLDSDYDWGEDRVILSEDSNLLENTDFNLDGHRIFRFEKASYSSFLKSLVERKVEEITSRKIDASEYHLQVSEEEHRKIINAMPYKKTESPELLEFAEYIETRVSDILGKRVKIFNDDIWIRICRPSICTDTDYNPCHRDIYLDFYRNIVNIYVPIVGSNEHSSLAMQSGSHLWNERDLVVTRGGAYFPKNGKKYSVDAILRSRVPLYMTRPNPALDEFILFSPYLIHGCSSNLNPDLTRMSVEVRFIEYDLAAEQEAAFNAFIESRNWR
jgi:hypothetical protein